LKSCCLALLALFVLVGISHAGSNSTSSITIDFSGITSAISALPNQIVDGFFTYAVSGLMSSSQQLVDASFKFMFSNPDPSWFCTPYNGVMAIV
jgi:uncharacterized protein YcfL